MERTKKETVEVIVSASMTATLKADCLFIGASGLPSGTVASALAVRAHCSVEIVRP